jgi:hypothetical protein
VREHTLRAAGTLWKSSVCALVEQPFKLLLEARHNLECSPKHLLEIAPRAPLTPLRPRLRISLCGLCSGRVGLSLLDG